MSFPLNQTLVLEICSHIILKSDSLIEEYNGLLGQKYLHPIQNTGIFIEKLHQKCSGCNKMKLRLFLYICDSMGNLKQFMYHMSTKHTHSTIQKLKQLQTNI